VDICVIITVGDSVIVGGIGAGIGVAIGAQAENKSVTKRSALKSCFIRFLQIIVNIYFLHIHGREYIKTRHLSEI
jgi:hypothetical protein